MLSFSSFPVENSLEVAMVALKARTECRTWFNVGVTVVYDFKQDCFRGQCLSVSIICKIKGNLYAIVRSISSGAVRIVGANAKYKNDLPTEKQDCLIILQIFPSTWKSN